MAIENKSVLVSLWWPAKLHLRNKPAAVKFLQGMVNRLAQGHATYGNPKQSKRYLTRLKAELKRYEKTGNAEHLYNLAVYAHLEQYAPEHPQAHMDGGVESVTRQRTIQVLMEHEV